MRHARHIVIGLLAAVLFLTCAGCSSEEGRTEKEPQVKQENIDLQGAKDESITCTYSDGRNCVFTAGIRNGKQTGPLVDTDRLITYDLKDGTKKTYSLKAKAYVYNAIAYKEGVLYAIYEEPKENEDTYKWYLKYAEGEKTRIVDSGRCKDFEQIPAIVKVEDKAVYHYVRGKEHTYEVGINVLDENLKFKNVFQYESKMGEYPQIYSNGKEYCFMGEKDGFPVYYIGDTSGIKYTKKMDKKLVSFGINDAYMLCSTASSKDHRQEYELLAVDLATGKETKKSTKEIYYRLCGSGDGFVYVDDRFAPYKINVEKDFEVEPFSFSGETDELSAENGTAYFFSTGDNGYFAEVDFGGDSEEKLEYFSLQI